MSSITLTNVKVSYWRKDIEYRTRGCGGPGLSGYQNISSDFGCAWSGATKDSWLAHIPDYAAHAFGDIGGDKSYPYGQLDSNEYNDMSWSNNDQRYFYNDNHGAYASGYNAFDGASDANYGDYSNVDAPSFSTITFHLPDPTSATDINPRVPYILCGYHEAGSLTSNDLEKYLNSYLFTPVVVGTDNKTYARIEFISNPDLSVYYGTSEKTSDLKSILTYWYTNIKDSFTTYGNNYCKGNNLIIGGKTGWCYSSCSAKNDYSGLSPTVNILTCDTNLTAFCQAGPGGTPYTPDAESVIKDGDSDATISSAFPNSTNVICNNFMPTNYYTTKATNAAAGTKDQGIIQIVKDSIAQNAYGIPECTGLGMKSDVEGAEWISNQKPCPNITTCVEEATFTNQGTISITGDIVIEQSTTCDGASSTGASPTGPRPPPRTPRPPPLFSKKMKIIIATATAATLISILLLFVLI